MNTIDLKNKRAVVTGGAQGFGLAITKRFIESGARVAIWDKDEIALQNVEVKDIHKINADVTSYDSVDKAKKFTLEKNNNPRSNCLTLLIKLFFIINI